MIARKFIVVVLAGCIPVVAYWGTVRSMIATWSMEPYRHGWIVVPISLLLLWRDRRRIEEGAFSGSAVGAAIVAALVLIWLVGVATSVQVVEQVAVVSMIGALVFAMTGWATFRSIWFPFAFLLFAVPIGASIVPALMDTTASIAVAALQWLDVPALREGMRVSLPGGTFEVVEACSGFNYLTAGVALGVLVAHLMFRSLWRQVSYVASIVVAFIFVNGVRAFLVMLVGSMSQMRWLVGTDHVIFGWFLFLAAMIGMYWLAERFSDLRGVPRDGA